jgi:hypothetical protein
LGSILEQFAAPKGARRKIAMRQKKQSPATNAPWKEAILGRIREHAAEQALNKLERWGANREQLLTRLLHVSLAHNDRSRMELQRMKQRTARAHAESIRQTADLIASLNRRVDNATLLGTIEVVHNVVPPSDPLSKMNPPWHVKFSHREIICWPEALRDYADHVESLPRQVKARWEPVRTAALSQLVWYVSQSTGQPRYGPVSELIEAILDKRASAQITTFDALKLKKWCERHYREIQLLGPLTSLPVLLNPPRGKRHEHV